jgi:hypothetical protein
MLRDFIRLYGYRRYGWGSPRVGRGPTLQSLTVAGSHAGCPYKRSRKGSSYKLILHILEFYQIKQLQIAVSYWNHWHLLFCSSFLL